MASYLAIAVVAASDELVTTLVERAVCQWQDVGTQNLEQEEMPLVVRLQLLHQFCLHQVRRTLFREESPGSHQRARRPHLL